MHTAPSNSKLALATFRGSVPWGGPHVETREWTGRLVAGRYDVEREIGRGGSATVFLARDTRDGTAVALKVLHEEYSGSRHAERFAIEIQLLRKFSHPSILPVLDAGESDGRPFFVMPYVEGESLQERLTRERRLPLDEVTRIGRILCDALGYAHQRKVVHRDVKPANIMLAGTQVFLADFGIAKALTPLPGQPHSTTGTARGTLAYMSPEQATADREIDHRSDIYSLGCVLFETIAGQHPFYSADEARMFAMRFTEPPDSLRRHRARVPAKLERAVLKALQLDPADRWQSARDMQDRLTPPEIPTILRPWKVWESSSRFVWLAAALAGVVGTAIYRRSWFGEPALVATSSAAVMAAELEPLAITAIVAAVRRVAPDSTLLRTTDRLANSVEHSLERWQGIPLRSLDDSSTIGSSGRVAFGRAGARAVARRKGIRYLIAISMEPAGDGHHVSATLVDVARDSASSLVVFAMPSPAAKDLDAAGQLIATSFLQRRAESFVPDDIEGTTNYGALREFQVATRLLNDWSLDLAAERLRRAIALDPRYAAAQLWLGQTLYWMRDSTSASLTAVRRAEALLAPEAPTSKHATALRALLERRFDLACRGFESLIRDDPLWFPAWMALGDCRRDDAAVVRDGTSASGSRFRSSWSEALTDYQRAIALAPAPRAKEALYATAADLLLTESGRFRLGTTIEGPLDTLAALPSLVNGVVHLDLEHVAIPLWVVRRNGAEHDVPGTPESTQGHADPGDGMGTTISQELECKGSARRHPGGAGRDRRREWGVLVRARRNQAGATSHGFGAGERPARERRSATPVEVIAVSSGGAAVGLTHWCVCKSDAGNCCPAGPAGRHARARAGRGSPVGDCVAR
ncbi:MAG: protein kinase [Gemmatimonadota bacterium]